MVAKIVTTLLFVVNAVRLAVVVPDPIENVSVCAANTTALISKPTTAPTTYYRNWIMRISVIRRFLTLQLS